MFKAIIRRIFSIFWMVFPKRYHWRFLWLFNSKFNVGVAGVIFNDTKQVLLLRHVHRSDYRWELPTGWLNSDETFASAIVREVLEETGLPITVERIIVVNSGFKLRVEVVMLGHSTASAITTNSLEIYDAKFFDLASLPERLSEDHLQFINLASNSGDAASEAL